MLYQLVGKASFTSSKGSHCTALHLVDYKPLANGVGHSCTTKITTLDCSNIELGKVDVFFNDRGFVESVTKA